MFAFPMEQEEIFNLLQLGIEAKHGGALEVSNAVCAMLIEQVIAHRAREVPFPLVVELETEDPKGTSDNSAHYDILSFGKRDPEWECESLLRIPAPMIRPEALICLMKGIVRGDTDMVDRRESTPRGEDSLTEEERFALWWRLLAIVEPQRVLTNIRQALLETPSAMPLLQSTRRLSEICASHGRVVPLEAVWAWESPDHSHVFWGVAGGTGQMWQSPSVALGYSLGDNVPKEVTNLLNGCLWSA